MRPLVILSEEPKVRSRRILFVKREGTKAGSLFAIITKAPTLTPTKAKAHTFFSGYPHKAGMTTGRIKHYYKRAAVVLPLPFAPANMVGVGSIYTL